MRPRATRARGSHRASPPLLLLGRTARSRSGATRRRSGSSSWSKRCPPPCPRTAARLPAWRLPGRPTAPTHPGALPPPLGGSPWPRQPASGRPKAEDFSTFKPTGAVGGAAGQTTAAGGETAGSPLTSSCPSTLPHTASSINFHHHLPLPAAAADDAAEAGARTQGQLVELASPPCLTTPLPRPPWTVLKAQAAPTPPPSAA